MQETEKLKTVYRSIPLSTCERNESSAEHRSADEYYDEYIAHLSYILQESYDIIFHRLTINNPTA